MFLLYYSNLGWFSAMVQGLYLHKGSLYWDPNGSSGKDLQIIAWSLLHQVADSLRNLCHKVSTSIKLFLLNQPSLLSPGHLLVNNCCTITEKLTLHNYVYLLVSGKDQIENLLTFTDRLDLIRSQPCKITFGAYHGSCWTNCYQILTQGSLGGGLATPHKKLELFERETYTDMLHCQPFCKNMSLTITFELKHLQWLDLCFESQGIRWCHLFRPMTFYDLDFSRLWPFWTHILGHISVIT